MNKIQNILVNYGDKFDIDLDWKYYSSIDFHNIVSIFNNGIMSINELNKRGLYEFIPQDNKKLSDVIKLYEINDKEALVKEYLKHQDAIIVSPRVYTRNYDLYIQHNKGLKALFKPFEAKKVPLSKDGSVVETFDRIYPLELVGIKIGDYSDTTLTLISLLLANNIDVELYDLVLGRRIMSSTLMNIIKLMDGDKRITLS